MTANTPANQAEHNQCTRAAYDRLAAIWSSTTDDGPFNGLMERPALRALVPGDLRGATVLDGIICSVALHYVADWSVPLRSFAAALRPGGWAVISLDHPSGPATLRLFAEGLSDLAGLPLFIVYRLWQQP